MPSLYYMKHTTGHWLRIVWGWEGTSNHLFILKNPQEILCLSAIASILQRLETPAFSHVRTNHWFNIAHVSLMPTTWYSNLLRVFFHGRSAETPLAAVPTYPLRSPSHRLFLYCTRISRFPSVHCDVDHLQYVNCVISSLYTKACLNYKESQAGLSWQRKPRDIAVWRLTQRKATFKYP